MSTEPLQKQLSFLAETPKSPRGQLLKWVGNKQRFAETIAAHFPANYQRYFEPFLGSGAVLATLQPDRAVASDSFGPLIEIWKKLRDDPEELCRWYQERWEAMAAGDKVEVYEEVKARFNNEPNGADLLFLCRSCYGGIVRFRKADGFMSTPCGSHNPISPDSFRKRVERWHPRVQGSDFQCRDFSEAMGLACEGDLVYCDPPYSHSQSILYGAQDFSLDRLFEAIGLAKEKGVNVALSVDGKKRSGRFICELPIPDGLFEREIFVRTGRSMLKRFQMEGESLEGEEVHDRLLLTY